MSIKRALNKESSYEIFFKLDEKCSRGISYSSQTVFFQSLHYTCFSGAICLLQVPGFGKNAQGFAKNSPGLGSTGALQGVYSTALRSILVSTVLTEYKMKQVFK